ncbi:hypothetical protein POX_c04332 [Penicillium oxalicum]|uniref:hypothetical protein n=1 Tax=Penicillium oxalicum TaxID=69781 RepID=UPI0020B846F9|nr:hypothetical protein POX_c04332 [Penicillium oxalicum]KAI2791471.1 hypothetical protein POX_c04332 [Penicillium oxalicum]
MPLIQLQPHAFTSIPLHPSLPDEPSRPQLHAYITSALREALDLLHAIPTTFTADSKLRTSSPSRAKVRLLRKWRDSASTTTGAHHAGSADTDTNRNRKIKSSGSSSGSEFWVCRQSEHVNARDDGTASWAEFQDGLRKDHAQHEMEYTPSVSAIEQLLEWEAAEIGEVEVDGVKFNDVEMEAFLIAPRYFISLTISAAYDKSTPPSSTSPSTSPTCPDPQNQPETHPSGFLTIQIPLHAAASSTTPALMKKISAAVPKRAIPAHYASVERVELRSGRLSASSASPSPASSYIEWTMATTSDAAGSIPQWVQRSWALGGVPKAVVADVGLFIGWTMRRRRGEL